MHILFFNVDCSSMLIKHILFFNVDHAHAFFFNADHCRYLDQPYCQANAKTGDWTCITTASPEHEGGSGEHMISQVSMDEGCVSSLLFVCSPACAFRFSSDSKGFEANPTS